MGLYRAFVFGALSLILLDLEIVKFEEINPILVILWIFIFVVLLISDDVDYKKIREIIKEELEKEEV